VAAGDKVKVQMMYTPGDFEPVPETRSKLMLAMLAHSRETVNVPLVSNEVEFVVTEEMVK
jgi:hypothetical protein